MTPNLSVVSQAPDEILWDWFSNHPRALVWLCALSLWISVSLIIQMWVRHRSASVARKLIWSVILLAPLFGWVFYAGGFRIPAVTDCPIPPSDGVASGGHL